MALGEAGLSPQPFFLQKRRKVKEKTSFFRLLNDAYPPDGGGPVEPVPLFFREVGWRARSQLAPAPGH